MITRLMLGAMIVVQTLCLAAVWVQLCLLYGIPERVMYACALATGFMFGHLIRKAKWPEDLRSVAPSSYEAMKAVENSARVWTRPVRWRGRGVAIYWSFEHRRFAIYDAHANENKKRFSVWWMWTLSTLPFVCASGKWELVDPSVVIKEGDPPALTLAEAQHAAQEAGLLASDVPIASTEGEQP